MQHIITLGKYLSTEASLTNTPTTANDISINYEKYLSMDASPTNTPTTANDMLISDAKIHQSQIHQQ